MKYGFLFCWFLAVQTLLAQPAIQSGPMNGYSEMREALVWVQVTEPAHIHLVYWPDTAPGNLLSTLPVTTEAKTAFTAHLIADKVEPGVRYGYHIYANGENIKPNGKYFFKTQTLYQYRQDPPDFKIALGSCAYVSEEAYDRPGKPYGTNYQIFETIADHAPDMMLWLGDNTYLREADYFTRTGILHRYTHTRSLPELQRLLHSTHHYAIWDDHDYGPNDANQTFPHKELTLEAFKLFWGNNGYGVSGLGGITGAFQFSDLHFYQLDNRWSRTDPDLATTEAQVLGSGQLEWLIQSLKYSRAPFKFVAIGGQVLNTAKVYENYSRYEAERTKLLDRIAAEGIQGVVILSGDRHHSELSRVEHKGALVYEITASPLTSGTHDPGNEQNENRVAGSGVFVHNFALVEISGPRKERVLKMEYKDANGATLFAYEIKASEWQKP